MGRMRTVSLIVLNLAILVIPAVFLAWGAREIIERRRERGKADPL